MQAQTTLSSKFQLAIPKEIREEMHLEAGQKFAFLRKGDILQLVPLRPLESFFNIVPGANTGLERDRSDRLAEG